MQVTVGPKYQIVIPKEVRKKIKGLLPGVQVSVLSSNKDTIIIRKPDKSWVERTRGMMTEAWKGLDTDAYLKKLRDEWD